MPKYNRAEIKKCRGEISCWILTKLKSMTSNLVQTYGSWKYKIDPFDWYRLLKTKFMQERLHRSFWTDN